MNPLSILRESWRITWHTRSLWALTGLMYITLLPAMILSGGFGALTTSLFLQEDPALRTMWSFRLPEMPDAAWIALAGLVLFFSVGANIVTWMIQAASIRATMAAAEGARLSVRDALALGAGRIRSIVRLGLTLGLLLAILGILPSLAAVLFARGTMVIQMIQTGLSPIISALSIALALILLAIAAEDLRPRAAVGRAWIVFKSGWWGFLLVVMANFLGALAVLVILIPVFSIVFAGFLLGATLQSEVTILLTAVGCGFSALLALVLTTLAMVFSTVLYSLTYRAASTLTSLPGTDRNGQT